MSHIPSAAPSTALGSIASLAMLAPLIVGAAIALSSASDGVALEKAAVGDGAAGGLRATQTRPIDLASLPAGAFGDIE